MDKKNRVRSGLVAEKKMKVWLVGDCGCEHHTVRHVCISKTTALKRWEEIRKELIEQNEVQIEYCKRNGCGGEMNERIAKNLSEPNPELMNNYPQDEPFIEEWETE
jgi:hypothetical protein